MGNWVYSVLQYYPRVPFDDGVGGAVVVDGDEKQNNGDELLLTTKQLRMGKEVEVNSGVSE